MDDGGKNRVNCMDGSFINRTLKMFSTLNIGN